MIKVRGWQISPAELEAQLLLHASIKDAAVIGIPSPEGDSELPRAYIVYGPGANVSELEIRTYMSAHLAKYKSLDGGVRSIDTIPKNSTGKILRKDLRDLATAEAENEQRLTVMATRSGGGDAIVAAPLTDESDQSTSSDPDGKDAGHNHRPYSFASDSSVSSAGVGAKDESGSIESNDSVSTLKAQTVKPYGIDGRRGTSIGEAGSIEATTTSFLGIAV